MRLALPVRPTSTMRCGRSSSVNVTSAQLKRFPGASTRKRAPGAAADRIDPRQVPVDEEVVGELGVVGDVLEVVEDCSRGAEMRIETVSGIHGVRQSKCAAAVGRRRRLRVVARASAARAVSRRSARGRRGARLAGDGGSWRSGRQSSQTSRAGAGAVLVEVDLLTDQRVRPQSAQPRGLLERAQAAPISSRSNCSISS